MLSESLLIQHKLFDNCNIRIIIWQASKVVRMNTQFETHIELSESIGRCSWKEKIAFFTQFSQEIAEERLLIPPKKFETTLATFLCETNINVLLKTLECLNIFTKIYGFQSLRLQRDIMHKLLDLTKMRRKEIDENISDIVFTLITKEKEALTHGQRYPLSFAIESFSRSSQPTFLLGASDDDGMDEEETQVQIIEESSQHNSYILDHLLEELKGCRKEVLILIARIASKLIKERILNDQELRSLSCGIESVKNVIIRRKGVQSVERAEIEFSISQVLFELTSKY